MKPIAILSIAAVVCLGPARPGVERLFCNLALAGETIASATPLADKLVLGDDASEKAHALVSDRSEVLVGALDTSARRLLAPAAEHWEGGHVEFFLKVDPASQNYVTVRLSGSDRNPNRLLLYCEGKQVGYRHLGDIDSLDIAHDSPRYLGRFYYNTAPLPFAMTQGKTEIRLEIHSLGPIFTYATTFANYQKMMREPSRGIYCVYSHTDGCFVPPTDEKQGQRPANPAPRSEPGSEVFIALRERVNHELQHLLTEKRPLNQMQAQFLARAWHVDWTPAHQQSKAVEQVIRSVDALHAAWRKDPKLLETDPATWNPGWFGFGPAADAVRLIAPLEAALDTAIDVAIEGAAVQKITRRAAWSEMFLASREWLRRHRRQYTNQTMIVDMNIYQSNRGLAAIDPSRAMPEDEALHYLYEALGIQPWLGSDTDQGPARPLGDHYYQLTAKGLTKELGYVGYYGEVLDWVAQIYDSTHAPGQRGDEKILAQMAKIAQARAVFRYPEVDDDGFRAMRVETVVGWRDLTFPGDISYVERGPGLGAAAATLDPLCVGAAQQMFADNQFFHSLANTLLDRRFRITIGLLDMPKQHGLLVKEPPSARRLPMSPGEPDFAWADEEDGVVAVKRGGEILYASLYWRANRAVNHWARVHYLAPSYERVAIVREEATFEPSGLEYTRPDWINFGFANGGFRYPDGPRSALAGEKLPIAKVPADESFKPGQENPRAGKADFYTLRYGPYLIAMNCSEAKTFELAPPEGIERAPELVSGKSVSLAAPLRVAPRSTVVLYVER